MYLGTQVDGRKWMKPAVNAAQAAPADYSNSMCEATHKIRWLTGRRGRALGGRGWPAPGACVQLHFRTSCHLAPGGGSMPGSIPDAAVKVCHVCRRVVMHVHHGAAYMKACPVCGPITSRAAAKKKDCGQVQVLTNEQAAVRTAAGTCTCHAVCLRMHCIQTCELPPYSHRQQRGMRPCSLPATSWATWSCSSCPCSQRTHCRR